MCVCADRVKITTIEMHLFSIIMSWKRFPPRRKIGSVSIILYVHIFSRAYVAEKQNSPTVKEFSKSVNSDEVTLKSSALRFF